MIDFFLTRERHKILTPRASWWERAKHAWKCAVENRKARGKEKRKAVSHV